MKVQDIVNRLTVLGLDETEAAVYVQLSILGPSKASDVAAALKLHRTEAYRTLQTLVQRGFASASLGRPSKFEAAPPERLFSEILTSLEARSQSIQRAQHEIAPALSTLRSQPGEAMSRNTFKVLQGRREIYAVMERMVREAQASIKALTTHEGAVAMTDMSGILEIALKRAQEGLRVLGAIKTTPASRSRLLLLPPTPNLEIRHVDADRIVRYVLADDRELLLWVVSDPSSRISSGEDVAIWTDASDFVHTELYHFGHVWQASRELRSLPPADGPPVADMRAQRVG